MPLQQINVSPAETSKNDTYSEHQCESSSSGGSAGVEICRICHCEGDADAALIAPCYCAGSLRYVHQLCLQQWIKSSNTRCCELCRFHFIMHTKTKPFTEWEPLDMNGFERRKLLCAVMFHAIALTCVVWSLYVLIDRTAEEIKQGLLEWPFWTKLIVVAIGFTGGVVFMYVQCKAYMQICQRWKAYNRVIYVQNAPEKQPLSISRVSTAQAQSCKLAPEDAPPSAPIHPKDETSIDLKGVTNVHIFFKDENQSVRGATDICSDEGCEGSTGIDSTIQPRQEQDTSMWHIKIGKGVPNDSTSSLRCNELEGLMNPEGREESAIASRTGDQSTTTLGDSVLKLQIKKAEIVIQFGQKSNNGATGSIPCPSTGNSLPTISDQPSCEDVQMPEINKDTSVNIKIDDKESEPIVIDVVKKTAAIVEEPVQIRVGFSEDDQRLLEAAEANAQQSDSFSHSPYPSSGTDSASHSPLLAHKNHDDC